MKIITLETEGGTFIHPIKKTYHSGISRIGTWSIPELKKMFSEKEIVLLKKNGFFIKQQEVSEHKELGNETFEFLIENIIEDDVDILQLESAWEEIEEQIKELIIIWNERNLEEIDESQFKSVADCAEFLGLDIKECVPINEDDDEIAYLFLGETPIRLDMVKKKFRFYITKISNPKGILYKRKEEH